MARPEPHILFIFCGLPGVGKTTIARLLARELRAVYLRIDTIETALSATIPLGAMEDQGYRVGYGLAADNLRLGQHVVADSVNPIGLSRRAWRDVALQCGVSLLEIEVICSDMGEHRRRVEQRQADMTDQHLPSWQEVEARLYEPWDTDPLRLDTAELSPEEAVSAIRARLTGSPALRP